MMMRCRSSVSEVVVSMTCEPAGRTSLMGLALEKITLPLESVTWATGRRWACWSLLRDAAEMTTVEQFRKRTSMPGPLLMVTAATRHSAFEVETPVSPS